VALAWERALDDVVVPDTRKVKLRSAVIVSPDRGGAFDILLGLVRHGLGGKNGNGRQFVSWIHYQDFVRAIYWLIAHQEIDGAVNLAAPHPLPNASFMRTLRQAAGVPFGVPASTWMIELGALLLRTESELVLKSRRVVPGRLLEGGFAFDYPRWTPAAVELVGAWQARRHSGLA
jgi:NAD dependent epimerase/dehydratase family enzyme